MGNSSSSKVFTPKEVDGEVYAVVGQKVSITCTIKKNEKEPAKELTEILCKVTAPGGGDIEVVGSDGDIVDVKEDKSVTLYEFTPAAAGKFKVHFTDMGPTNSNSSKNVTVFANEAAKETAIQRLQNEKQAKKAKEKAEAEAPDYFKSEGGAIKSVQDLKPGMSLVIGAAVEGGVRATICNEEYIISGLSLTPNSAASEAIAAKVASFPSFPKEDAKRPKKNYPKDMSLADVFTGAVRMRDPYSLKQCLARGAADQSKLDEAVEKIASSNVAKKSHEWRTDFGVSVNWSGPNSFSTYRQSCEASGVACTIVLLAAGANVSSKARAEAEKQCFFGKKPRERILRVFDANAKGIHFTSLDPLDDLSKPLQLDSKLLESKPEAKPEVKQAEEEAKKVEETPKVVEPTPREAAPAVVPPSACGKPLTKKEALVALYEKHQQKMKPSLDEREAMWKHYDRNGDGELDLVEARAMLQDCIAQTRQKQLEARAKGVTSTAESSMLDFAEKALLEQEKGVADDAKMEKLMGKLDLNGDGKVSKSEFLAVDNPLDLLGNFVPPEMQGEALGVAMGAAMGAMGEALGQAGNGCKTQ